jgi:uncharacterized protein YukE
MADLKYELQAELGALVEGADGWQGAAAQAFGAHIDRRRQVLDTAEQALLASAQALEEYATRLERAQESCLRAEQQARAAGLRIAGDQVDPSSLLPPEPSRLLVAADVSRQLAEVAVEGMWASTQLASALAPQEQLARRAEWLLGDRSGLKPAGFLTDLMRGPTRFFWEMGLGGDRLLGAAAMAGLGNGRGMEELGQEYQAMLRYAEEHPSEAVQAFIGSDQVHEAWADGHPGEAIGLAAANLATVLNPEEEGTKALQGLEEEARLGRQERLLRDAPPQLHPDDLALGTTLPVLPAFGKVEIDPRKFTQYSMDASNSTAGGKWKGFEDLGYDVHSTEGRATAAQDVTAQLEAQLSTAPAVLTAKTKFGPRYRVAVEIVGSNGRRATLTTYWQIDNGSDRPRLITNWVSVHR